MMSNNENLISEFTLQGNTKEILISGVSIKNEEINPYFGLGNIEFNKNSVRIKVLKTKIEEDIKILVFRWCRNELETQKYLSINGTIKIPKKKIIINNEGKTIPWKTPLVDILIVFEKAEYLAGNIQTIRLYFAPANYKKWYKRLFSSIITHY